MSGHRLYCIMGLPASGKGAIASALVSRMRSKGRQIGVVSSGDIARRLATEETDAVMADGSLFPFEDRIRAEIARAVRKELANGAEAVLLDGAPRFVQQLQWVESEFFDLDPVYVRINVPDEHVLVQRLAARARDEFDTDPAKAMARINKQRAMLSECEAYIHSLALAYYGIMNDDISRAVSEWAGVIPPPGRTR